MNDEQLTRELERALTVEPTPQFLARVRREIEAERRRPAGRVAWTAAVAGTSALTLLLAVSIFHSGRPSQPAAALEPIQAAAVLEEVASPSAATRAIVKPSTEVHPKVARREVTPRSTEPEVLIDPRETAALQSFLDAVQERKIDPSRLEEIFESAERVRSAPVEPMPIAAIEPIVITPLVSADPQTGGDL